MKRYFLPAALTLATAGQFTLHAEDAPESANRFSFGARFGMNFKAAFRNSTPVAPVPVPAVPGPAIGGVNHAYDDGYVSLDSSGNAGGTTWNWGYQNASQVVGDTMQFHAAQSTPTLPANNKITGDPQYGAELNYQRVIGPLPFKSGRWGLEAAFGATDIDLRNNRNASGASITDTFQLNGVISPGAGYNGTFVGPGPLLGDTPTRTATIDSQTSRQKLTGCLYSIRLGPFAEWNLSPQWSLAAGAGLTLAPTRVDYDFSDTSNIAGVTTVASGHSSKSDLLYGPYVSATLRYDFNEHWGIYVGAQFQSLTDLQQTIGARTARLDQGLTAYGVVGLSWRF